MVSTIIRLWAGHLKNCVSIPCRSRRFSSSTEHSDLLQGPYGLLFNGYLGGGGLLPGSKMVKARCWLAIPLQLALWFRIITAMSLTGTSSPFSPYLLLIPNTTNYFLCSLLWLSLTNTKCCCCLQWGETCLPRAELLGTEGEAWLITTELMVPTSGCAADPLLVASECCCCCAWSASAEDATGTVAEHTADWLAVLSTVPITLLPHWFGTSLLSSEKPRKHRHKWKKEMLLKTWHKSKKVVILVQLSK